MDSDMTKYIRLKRGFQSYKFAIDSPQTKELVRLERKLINEGKLKIEETY